MERLVFSSFSLCGYLPSQYYPVLCAAILHDAFYAMSKHYILFFMSSIICCNINNTWIFYGSVSIKTLLVGDSSLGDYCIVKSVTVEVQIMVSFMLSQEIILLSNVLFFLAPHKLSGHFLQFLVCSMWWYVMHLC